MKMTVDLKEKSYPIYIEKGILSRAGAYIKEICHGKKVMIISDDNVYALYGEKLKSQLSNIYECHETVIPHGSHRRALLYFPSYMTRF